MLKCLNLLLILIILNNTQAGFTTTDLSKKPLWNQTTLDRLRHDLLLNYDKFARPAPHSNMTTTYFGFTVTHAEINELKNLATVYGWARMQWTDEKLKWNPADYDDIKMLHFADHELWQPDLFLYNGMPPIALGHFVNIFALVQSTGDVIFVPPVTLSALCELNLKYWPFDTQKCKLVFGSWTYHGMQINLQLTNDLPVEKDLIIQSTEWKITKTTATREEKIYSCCVEAYPSVTFEITLERVSPSYKAIIITPTFAIICMILLSFWLPPQAGEKILLQVATAILISMFLLYFSTKIPAMGSHTPLIVLFYSTSLYVLCFTLIGSIVVLWISRTRHPKNLPWAIKQPLIGSLGKLLGLSTYIALATTNVPRITAEEMRDHQSGECEENNTNDDRQIIDGSVKAPLQEDWILLGAAIDRISFIVYSLLFAILSIVYAL